MNFFVALLCSIFMFSSFAGSLLNCKSHNFNPYYYFTISTNETNEKQGQLDKAFNGFTGEERNQLWSDPLDFSLESYTCQLEIYSIEKSLDEFTVNLDLNKIINNRYTGTILGSLIEETQNISCIVLDIQAFLKIKSNCINR